METNKEIIVEYSVYEEIESKYPPPILFKENAKAKDEATHISQLAKKNGFSVFCDIERREVGRSD